VGQRHPLTGTTMITLLSRPGCHLCDEAREVIARVAADLGVAWEERDITRSDSDMRDYWDQIPVTLIDGVRHDFWRVSETRLRAALAAATGPGQDPARPGPSRL
jgi:glutaredoxin